MQFSIIIPGGAAAAEFRVSAGPEVPAGDLVPIGPGPTDFQIQAIPVASSGTAPFDFFYDLTFLNHSGDVGFHTTFGDGQEEENANWDGSPWHSEVDPMTPWGFLLLK